MFPVLLVCIYTNHDLSPRISYELKTIHCIPIHVFRKIQLSSLLQGLCDYIIT